MNQSKWGVWHFKGEGGEMNQSKWGVWHFKGEGGEWCCIQSGLVDPDGPYYSFSRARCQEVFDFLTFNFGPEQKYEIRLYTKV
jgi:hypothetical protein